MLSNMQLSGFSKLWAFFGYKVQVVLRHLIVERAQMGLLSRMDAVMGGGGGFRLQGFRFRVLG